MVILKNFTNILKIPELTRKLLITIGIIIIERIGTFIPVIGVNINALSAHIEKTKAVGGIGGLLGYFDVLSGGALAQSTLFALGIGPYITASIMMQILSMTIPTLEALQKEGEHGRRVINQYTRYLGLFLAIMYSSIYAGYLMRSGFVLTPGLWFTFTFVLSLTTGAMFVMWLAEQISLFGLGNGSSMIIFAGIVSRFPSDLIRTVTSVQRGLYEPYKALLVWGIFIILTAFIVYLEKGTRKVPVQYARRVIGNKVYGGQTSYIPFKLNSAGVMPVIFAGQLLQVPSFIANMLSGRFAIFKTIATALAHNGVLWNALQFSLIMFFTFFYTALIFNPTELADQMKKNGGFIPGIRPGKKTADFFEYVLNRIGLIGALYLSTLAILPNIVMNILTPPFYLGGTSLLIAVGVALELASQIESYLIEHRYEGFLTSGRMKSNLLK